MNLLKIILSLFKEIYMLIMDYPSIRGEYLSYNAKNSTWNLFHAYIDSHSQMLIDEYVGYGLKAISRLKSQCANMTFDEQSRYNRLFHQVVHKGG